MIAVTQERVRKMQSRSAGAALSRSRHDYVRAPESIAAKVMETKQRKKAEI